MQSSTLRFFCPTRAAQREAQCAGQSGLHRMHQNVWVPTPGILPTLQVLVNSQGKDNGAAVEKNMIISLIQSLVSTLQLNERPKSQAGQPGRSILTQACLLGPALQLASAVLRSSHSSSQEQLL